MAKKQLLIDNSPGKKLPYSLNIKEWKEEITEALEIPSNDNVIFKPYNFNPWQKGANTDIVFTLQYNETTLLVKIGRKDKSEINEATAYIRNNHSELEKNLILPILTGQFKDGIFYELLPVAEGNSFFDINIKYMKHELNAEYLNNCYYSLGSLLSHTHLLGKTNNEITDLSQLTTHLLHKDTKGPNVFCNNGVAKLIDNEGFVDSIKIPSTVEEELKYTLKLGFNVYDSKMLKENEIKGFYKAFLKGYSSNLHNYEYSEYLTSILVKVIEDIYENHPSENTIPQDEKNGIINEILDGVFPDQQDLISDSSEIIGNHEIYINQEL